MQNYKSHRKDTLYLDDHGYGDEYLDTTLKSKSMKTLINKLNFIKINFCSVKDYTNRIRRQTSD